MVSQTPRITDYILFASINAANYPRIYSYEEN
jgi:hypothetical protein